MRESPNRSSRSVPEPSSRAGGKDERPERNPIDDRREAIRRWIDDDADDSACRSID